MAIAPLGSQGPHSGEISIRLHNPYLPGVPIVRRNEYGYFTHAFSRSS